MKSTLDGPTSERRSSVAYPSCHLGTAALLGNGGEEYKSCAVGKTPLYVQRHQPNGGPHLLTSPLIVFSLL